MKIQLCHQRIKLDFRVNRVISYIVILNCNISQYCCFYCIYCFDEHKSFLKKNPWNFSAYVHFKMFVFNAKCI